jgi:hypothetical protein
VGALLKPDKAPLRNVGIIALILVEARIVSLYGLYGKSQAHRATQARWVIGRVGLHALAQPAGLGLCAQVNPTGPRTPARPTPVGLYPTHLEA